MNERVWLGCKDSGIRFSKGFLDFVLEGFWIFGRVDLDLECERGSKDLIEGGREENDGEDCFGLEVRCLKEEYIGELVEILGLVWEMVGVYEFNVNVKWVFFVMLVGEKSLLGLNDGIDDLLWWWFGGWILWLEEVFLGGKVRDRSSVDGWL